MTLPDPNRPRGRTKVFLPYAPFALDPVVPVEVRRLEVEGDDVTAEAVDPGRCRIRPHVVADWQRAEAGLRVPDVRETVAEAAGLAPDEVGFAGRVWCRATRWRGGIRFREEDGAFVAALPLRRADVEGLVEIDVSAVRTGEAAEAHPGRAAHAGSLLAAAPQWLLEVVPVESPAAGAFDFAYVDFRDPQPDGPYRGEDARLLPAIATALSHTVIREHGPLVLLNRGNREVVDVLLSRGTVGARARLRDVMLQHVASSAWRTILEEAWLACRPSEEQPEEWARLGDEHWATRSLVRAAKERHGTLDDPVQALLADLNDDALRPGLLHVLSERLGGADRDVFGKFVKELVRAS